MRNKIIGTSISYIIFGALALLLLPVTPVNAVLIDNPLGKNANSLSALFKGIIQAVLQLGTIVAALGVMYGGFMYVTAGGDEEKLGKAQKTITWAMVGTAVLLGSNVLITAITETVKNISNPTP